MEILDVVFVWQMKEENQIRWHSRYHAHGKNEFELHYFIQGNGSFLNDRTRFGLEPGTLFITTPETHHSIIVDDRANPISYYAVLIRTEGPERDIQRLMTIDLKSNRTYKVGTNYRFFFEEIREKGLSANRALRKSAVHQFISFLYLLSGEEDFHFSDGRNSHIEKALRIMQNGITGDLDLDEIARRLGLSPSYFIRLFRQKMNTTPMKYLMKLKIEAAGAMLTSTDRPMLTIAQDLGFYSEFHFSRVFKQYTGSAPSRYRKQYLQLAGDKKEEGNRKIG